MSVTIICPNLKCRSMLQVAEKARGKKVRCSQCGTPFMIPAKLAEKTKPPLSPTNEPSSSS